MLYRTLKRMIERGQTDGMEEKIDIFFAAGKLTEAEYTGLMDMLHPKTDTDANVQALWAEVVYILMCIKVNRTTIPIRF